jgi:hypothetical protein
MCCEILTQIHGFVVSDLHLSFRYPGNFVQICLTVCSNGCPPTNRTPTIELKC